MKYFVLILFFGSILSAQKTKEDSLSALKEVEVIIRKSTVESKADRTVFNVANSSILIGNSTWDVIRMTPLVEIDNNNELKVTNQKVIVYINNRKSIFTGKDLMQYLKSMPADNIVKIEVITAPSGRYESSGPVINIILKKLETEGIKGSATFNNKQQQKNHQEVNSVVNYHKNKFTQGITFHMGKQAYLHRNSNENRLNGTNSVGFISGENIDKDFHIGGTSTSEYELNDKNTIGFIGELHTNLPKSNANSTSNFFENDVLKNSFLQNQTNVGQNKMVAGNLFYTYFDEKKDKTFDVNLNAIYKNNYNQNEIFTFSPNNLNPNSGINIGTDESVRNYSVKVDYAQPIDSTGYSIETGGKINYLNLSNPYDFSNFLNQNFVLDNAQTNDFSYKENINSLYFNVNKEYFKKLDVRIGLRFENTEITTIQEVGNIRNHQSYNKLLPNILLKYTFNEKQNLSINYNQFLWRPSSMEFNPFLFPTTNGFSFRGNPSVNPATYHTFDLKFGFLKKYNLSLRYNFHNSDYWNVYKQENGITISSVENLDGRSESYGVSFNTNQNFFKDKLNINFNAFFRYNDNSDFNMINNLEADSYLADYGASVNFSYTNLFNKNFNINSWIGYYSPQIWGNSVGNNTNINHNFSVTKIFKSLEMDVKLEAINPFAQPYWDNTAYTEIGTFRTNQVADWRGVSFSIVKRFGNQKAKSSSKTETDKDRISGGGK